MCPFTKALAAHCSHLSPLFLQVFLFQMKCNRLEKQSKLWLFAYKASEGPQTAAQAEPCNKAGRWNLGPHGVLSQDLLSARFSKPWRFIKWELYRNQTLRAFLKEGGGHRPSWPQKPHTEHRALCVPRLVTCTVESHQCRPVLGKEVNQPKC